MQQQFERFALVTLLAATLAFMSGCYSTHASIDGVVRINRATGEVCIYEIKYEESGLRFVDVYCEE